MTSLTAADRVKLHHFLSGTAEREKNEHESLREQYKSYKESYVKNMQFDPEKPNLSKHFFSLTKAKSHTCVSGVLVDHSPLEEVFIFFDTATFDEIERDVKVDKTP